MSTENQNFLIRPAENVEEVSSVWWPLMKELGWNRDHDDAITHFHVTSKGKDWLLLVSKETGKPEGCVVSFTYPNGTGWVGFFILNAPFRGRGWGGSLWKEMELSFRANNITVIGLDGVEEQVNTYKRRGFEDCARIHLMTRESCKEKSLPVSIARSVRSVEDSREVKDIKWIDPQLLAKMDFEHTGLDRSAYWSQEGVLARGDAYGYALLSSGKLVGYIFVRRCEQGHRFGPLYAEDYSQAKTLLYTAMTHISDSSGSMIAEIFGTNTQGIKVFEELGWAWAGLDYHRMWYRGLIPKEQQEGGKGTKGMFAIFDACAG